MITRRIFAAGALALAAAPFAARAQQAGRRAMIAYLASTLSDEGPGDLASFRVAMRERGLAEGRDYDLIERYSEGEPRRLAALVTEIVALRPTVILASNLVVAMAVRQATSAVPIIFVNGADPVAAGAAESYRRPGGNMTGIMGSLPGLYGKRLKLLLEVKPDARSVGLLINPDSPAGRQARPEIEASAAAKKVRLVTVDIHAPEELEPAYQTFARERVDLVLGVADPIVTAAHKRIAALEVAAGIAAIHNYRDFVEAGSLMSYGLDRRDNYARVAYMVVKVLQGEKVGEIPIDVQPKTELVINLKTAKAFGLTIPEHLLVFATAVIE